MDASTEQFVRRLTEHQTRLYGYIYSLIGDRNRAADVLQETNLVLWRKLAEFDSKRPFLPWALGVARYQVLAHIRDQKRDRLLLNTELAESLSAEVAAQSEHIDSMREALQSCIEKLTDNNQKLIRYRYSRMMPIREVADELKRSVGSVKVALLRVRRKLAQCVERRLGTDYKA